MRKVLFYLVSIIMLFGVTGCESSTKSTSLVGNVYIGTGNESSDGYYTYELELKASNECVWTSKFTGGKPSKSDCTYTTDGNSMTLQVGDDGKPFVYTTSDNFMTLIRKYDGFTLTKITSSEDRIVDDTKSNSALEMLHQYTVVATSDGSKRLQGYITFKNDGTCSTTFAFFNNCTSSGEFCVFYRPSDCSYEIDENNVITVNDNSYFEVQYAYKLGNGATQRSIIENGYTMKDIKFQYTVGNDVLETINGKWDIKNGNGFYYIYFTAD